VLIEMMMFIALIVLGTFSSIVFYKLGYYFGEKAAIDRLIDAKDSEAWNYAHYIRADKKEEESNRNTPRTAFAAMSEAEAALAPTKIMKKRGEGTETALLPRKPQS
jgi:hypothetical protein